MILPILRLRERLQIERADSDVAYFMCLLYYGEMVIKLFVAALIAGIEDDRDRHRYTQIYRLVRADGLGDWISSLDDIFVGPTAQFLSLAAREIRKEFTTKAGPGSWQYESLVGLRSCLSAAGVSSQSIPSKVNCGQWFQDFVSLRNKTRGHGATRPASLSAVCDPLRDSINAIADRLSPFALPWAYVKRNLSGKYRISMIGGDPAAYDPIRKRPDTSLENGVYVVMNG